MTDRAISPLRRRMIEDMTIRKFASKTQHDYVQRVKHFAVFLGRSPDTASFEDVRRYQLHLAESGAGVPTLNQSVSTLRFFFKITLGRADIKTAQFIRVTQVPVILGPEEVARFLDAAPGLKYKAALSVAYGAGLRVSEVVALKVSDIDGFLQRFRLIQGQGIDAGPTSLHRGKDAGQLCERVRNRNGKTHDNLLDFESVGGPGEPGLKFDERNTIGGIP